jgi:DNA modification methylase
MTARGQPVRLVQYAEQDYTSFYESSKRAGCEGIVLKRADSTLRMGAERSLINPGWLKIKHTEHTANKPSDEQPTPIPPGVNPSDGNISPALVPLCVPIDSVRLDKDNAREHPSWNLDAIKNSLRRFGQQKPIVVDSEGTVRAGNGTWAAAKAMGWNRIAVVVSDLTAAEMTAYAIADNRTAEMALWNEEVLAAQLQAMDATLRDAAGFTEKDLQRLMGMQAPGRLDGSPPILEGPVVTQPGDLWTLGDHRLLCADATLAASWEALLGGIRAKLIYTDPPYGIKYETRQHRETVINDDLTDDKLIAFLTPAFRAMVSHAEDTAAFYIWYAPSTRAEFDHAVRAAGLIEQMQIIWAKPAPTLGHTLGHTDYRWSHEPAYYASKAGNKPTFYGDRCQHTIWRVAVSGAADAAAAVGTGLLVVDGAGGQLWMQNAPPKGKKVRKMRIPDGANLQVLPGDSGGTVWEVSRDSNPIHPTQKPVELARRALENSSLPGDVVVDPFMGSGSTLIACETYNRRGAGFELSPEHCDAIVNRWQTLTGKVARRFGADGSEKPGITSKGATA